MNLKRKIQSYVKEALLSLELAYCLLDNTIKNEIRMLEKEKEDFYKYGIESVHLDLLRIVNARKGLLKIIGKN